MAEAVAVESRVMKALITCSNRLSSSFPLFEESQRSSADTVLAKRKY